MQNNIIITERLILREISEGDANQIVSWRKNPSVYKYFRSPHELTYEEHMKWYAEIYMKDYSQIQFIAEEKMQRNAIGVFSVRKCKNQNWCIEVSYLLDQKAQGNGYAQEAVLAMMKFALEEWNAQKVIAEIHKDNYPSLKMVQKMGFTQTSINGDFLIFERELCYI